MREYAHCTDTIAELQINNKSVVKGICGCISQDDPTAHPAVDLVRKAKVVLKSADLSSWNCLLSQVPCPLCARALLNAKITHFQIISEKKTLNVKDFLVNKIR